ncbi:MAG: sulfatase-like hydrolase/transferase, partial [Thermoanaerobaculia bacterium]
MPSRRLPAFARLRAASLAPLSLLVLATAACRREPPPPIVVISVDTLRADRLPAYGYRQGATPALDRLARDSVVFDAAYTHYPLTLPAHVSAFTGLLPPNHGVRDNVGYPLDAAAHPPIQQRLAAAGWATGGFVSSFVLRKETGFAAGFGSWDEPAAPARGAPMDSAQRAATATLAPALDWLGRREEGPFFLFFHLYEPHAPYTPPEPFAARHADPYDGEVEAADAAIGTLIERLRAEGLYDRAVVVLMSDHGEGLGDHGELQHGVFLYRSTLRVALMVKLPGQRRAGERVARPVGLVDLAPTLARLARVDPGAGLDGRDLLAPDPDGESARGLYAETYYPRLHFGWSDLAAMIEPRWYFIRGPQPELFDLDADPGLARDVLAANRGEYARLRRRVEEIDRPLAEPQGVDEETAQRLAALGYLSAGNRTADLDLPDPKTQRHLLAGIEAGLSAFWAGRDAEAARHFETVLAANPSMADIWAYLARAHDRRGDKRAGLAAWERVLELSGGMGTVALTVGEHYLELGNPEQAARLADGERHGAHAPGQLE